MKKFLAVMGLLTVIATPAFAQSFDPDEGSGNALPFAYTSHVQGRVIARSNGEQAYAMAPQKDISQDPYSPANTGGGSEGYNWNLAHNL